MARERLKVNGSPVVQAAAAQLGIDPATISHAIVVMQDNSGVHFLHSLCCDDHMFSCLQSVAIHGKADIRKEMN